MNLKRLVNQSKSKQENYNQWFDEFNFDYYLARINVKTKPESLGNYLKSDMGNDFLDIVKNYLEGNGKLNLFLLNSLYERLPYELSDEQTSNLFRFLNDFTENEVNPLKKGVEEVQYMDKSETDKLVESSLKMYPFITKLYSILVSYISQMYGLDKLPKLYVEQVENQLGCAYSTGEISVVSPVKRLKENNERNVKVDNLNTLFHEMTHIKQYADIAHIYEQGVKYEGGKIVHFDKEYFKSLPIHYKLLFYSMLVDDKNSLLEEKDLFTRNADDYNFAYFEVDARLAGFCESMQLLRHLQDELALLENQVLYNNYLQSSNFTVVNGNLCQSSEEKFFVKFKAYWLNTIRYAKRICEEAKQTNCNGYDLISFCDYIGSLITEDDIRNITTNIKNQFINEKYKPYSILEYDKSKESQTLER